MHDKSGAGTTAGSAFCYNAAMKKASFWRLCAAIAICELAGLVSLPLTAGSDRGWYSALARPALNPPSWIFGPVWTLLYALMGIAAFIVWEKMSGRTAIGKIIDDTFHRKAKRSRARALRIFAIQLALNAIWSIIFFGAKNPGAALIDIALLWIAILLTIILFYRISRTAAFLMIPYLLWVSFAAYLNFGIWWLN